MTLASTALTVFRLHRKSAFRHPMDPAPRTAVLADCFRQTRLRPNYPVRVFPEGWSEEASRFVPAAIAASRETLFTLAAADRPPVLTHAIIALASPADPVFSIAERERLWQAFRVPIFEQIIGPNGELLAAECEAHEGLHIEVSGLTWDEFQVDMSPCGCGCKTPRLTPARPAERARSVAGYAR